MDSGALKLTFGSHDYYVASIKAGLLVAKSKAAQELEQYTDLTAEERFQRELSWTRIVKEIAPYLSNNPDRFFGPLIMAVAYPDDCNSEMSFEPIKDIGSIPQLYKQKLSQFGILSIPEDAHIIPLDGQHRLKALQTVIDGANPGPKGGALPSLRNEAVGSDDVTCIFVPLKPLEKSRSIFVKINKHAKTVTKVDKILLDDNDIAAVLAREIGEEFFPDRLMRNQTSIPDTGNEIITLETIHLTIKFVADCMFATNKQWYESLPSEAEQRTLRTAVTELFTSFVKIPIIKEALKDPDDKAYSEGRNRRIKIRSENLLLKPAFTQSYLQAWATLAYISEPELSHEDVRKRFENLPTTFADETFKGIIYIKEIVTSDDGSEKVKYKMETVSERKKFTKEFILYLMGFDEDKQDIHQIKRKYLGFKSAVGQIVGIDLPDRLV
mgnify:FL=1